MKFTERFNECLKYSDLKQSEIAIYCKTSRQNITNFKAGRTFPSIETLYLLCQCLEVSADYLLGLEDETGAKTYTAQNAYYNHGTHNGNVNF